MYLLIVQMHVYTKTDLIYVIYKFYIFYSVIGIITYSTSITTSQFMMFERIQFLSDILLAKYTWLFCTIYDLRRSKCAHESIQLVLSWRST